jgi:hypothetical protein
MIAGPVTASSMKMLDIFLAGQGGMAGDFSMPLRTTHNLKRTGFFLELSL